MEQNEIQNINQNVQTNTQKTDNGLAIAGMIVGISSIILSFCGITGIVGLILSILGLNNSKKCNSGKDMAIAGIICSAIGILIGVITVCLLIAMIFGIDGMLSTTHGASNSLNDFYNSLDQFDEFDSNIL